MRHLLIRQRSESGEGYQYTLDMRLETPRITVSPILCLPVNTEILVYSEPECEVFELRCAHECPRLWVTVKTGSVHIGPARDKEAGWLKVVEEEKTSG